MGKLNPKTISLAKAKREIEEINKRIVKKSEEMLTYEKLLLNAKEKILELNNRKTYIKSILQKKKFNKTLRLKRRRLLEGLLHE